MPTRATGTFEVTMMQEPPSELAAAAGVGRMTLDKRNAGDLEGAAAGEMLAVRTATEGSAVYVAIERVTGTLGGRSGAFALHHTGVMERGAPSLAVRVV